jgi:hypothetical protein
MLSIMSSISGNIREPLSTPTPTPTPTSGLNTINASSLVYYYNFETDTVSGSMLKNMVTNDIYDATLVGPSLISSTTFRNGSSALNCGSGSDVNNRRYTRLTTPTNFHSTTISICFKFYLTSLSGFPCLFQILSGDGTPVGSTVISQIQLYNGTGSNRVIRLVCYGATPLELIISSTIQLNTWYSFAMTKNGNAINIYINGQFAAGINNTTNYLLTTNANNIWVSGIDFKQQTHEFNGFIDDFRIYTRDITLAEVSNLHTSLE